MNGYTIMEFDGDAPLPNQKYHDIFFQDLDLAVSTAKNAYANSDWGDSCKARFNSDYHVIVVKAEGKKTKGGIIIENALAESDNDIVFVVHRAKTYRNKSDICCWLGEFGMQF